MFVLGAESTAVIHCGITLVVTVYLLPPFSGYLSQVEIDRGHTELLKELRETHSMTTLALQNYDIASVASLTIASALIMGGLTCLTECL